MVLTPSFPEFRYVCVRVCVCVCGLVCLCVVVQHPTLLSQFIFINLSFPIKVRSSGSGVAGPSGGVRGSGSSGGAGPSSVAGPSGGVRGSGSSGLAGPSSVAGPSGGVRASSVAGPSGLAGPSGGPGSSSVAASLQEWRQLRHEQDLAFLESLEVDQRKDRARADLEWSQQVT